jgi:hypothetical protein
MGPISIASNDADISAFDVILWAPNVYVIIRYSRPRILLPDLHYGLRCPTSARTQGIYNNYTTIPITKTRSFSLIADRYNVDTEDLRDFINTVNNNKAPTSTSPPATRGGRGGRAARGLGAAGHRK